MSNTSLKLPAPGEIQQHIMRAASRYWNKNEVLIHSLPVCSFPIQSVSLPLRLKAIPLPEWASTLAVNGVLLVPEEVVLKGSDWQSVNWWLAAFLLLEGWHERVFETIHGPIHSYSQGLKHWDSRVWDYAWVNRIALFLRAWAAQEQGIEANDLFGAVAPCEMTMTHDVDAIKKTLPIRLKQSLFYVFNAQRNICSGQFLDASKKIFKSIRFLFGFESWWCFDDLLLLEEKAGIVSHFNFYADERRKTPRSWLLDPSYSISSLKLKHLFADLKEKQHVIGLHSSFDAWKHVDVIRPQQQKLSQMSEANVTSCRQHWLRFSWADTWAAQEEAGICNDSTLMFNDRPGFRVAAALKWKPWNTDKAGSHGLEALPTVLMDSHVYDYKMLSETGRRTEIKRWLDECQFVNGDAAVLWHPHTLTKDYGWKAGFEYLLGLLSTKKIEDTMR